MPGRFFSDVVVQERDSRSATARCSIDALDPMSKRQRIIGLNARYDRMLVKVGQILPSRARNSGRKRTHSVGSSSVSSHSMPKTPVDAYSRLDEGRLGRDFKVIKLNRSLNRSQSITLHNRRNSSDRGSEYGFQLERPPKNVEPLPSWLSDTFNRLEVDHPMRLLLPPSQANCVISPLTDHMPNASTGRRRSQPAEDPIFAFSPPNPENTPIGPPSGLPSLPECSFDAQRRLEMEFPSNQVFDAVQQTSYSPEAFAHSFLDNCSPTAPLSATCKNIPLELVPFSAAGPLVSANLLSTPHPDFSPALMLEPLSSSSDPFPSDLLLERQLETQFAAPNFVSPDPDGFYDAENVLLPDSDSLPSPLPKPQARPLSYTSAFATPGPHHTYCPIYFDTPTSDPVSDPREPGFELDYTELDFQWTPFHRSGLPIAEERTRSFAPSTEGLSVDDGPVPADEHAHFDFSPEIFSTPALETRGSSHGLRSSTLLDDNFLDVDILSDLDVTGELQDTPDIGVAHLGAHVAAESTHADDEVPTRKAPFAPAPDIYISPIRSVSLALKSSSPAKRQEVLRNSGVSALMTEPVTEEMDVEKSQDSNDSIESWPDENQV